MTVILDSNGTVLEVGMRVLDKHGNEEGTITQLTEPDGDYDDELQRAVAIGPYVYVSYDSGESDRYTALWNATGPWDDHIDEYTCDDVTVARPDSDDRTDATDAERDAGTFFAGEGRVPA